MLSYIKSNGEKVEFNQKEITIIAVENNKYIFYRILNGKIVETYASVEKDKASVYAISIIQDFQPPRCLVHQDKLVG
mgnify:CR=1 FL=1